MSVQYDADASQKFTCPGVTAALPASTVAANVIGLPEDTVFTVLPPDVTPRVVVVGTPANSGCEPSQKKSPIAAIKKAKTFR